ncbi:hypothetical protein GCM10010349_75900 [Streptomyces flavofungini]|nr:hypothetical protein GCM10010349_75900 [Streptomyces flavofungini]
MSSPDRPSGPLPSGRFAREESPAFLVTPDPCTGSLPPCGRLDRTPPVDQFLAGKGATWNEGEEIETSTRPPGSGPGDVHHIADVLRSLGHCPLAPYPALRGAAPLPDIAFPQFRGT